MTQILAETMGMLEMLPEQEQKFANEFVKRLVLAWDPDYTKLTAGEKKHLEDAEKRMDSGDFIRAEDLDWN